MKRDYNYIDEFCLDNFTFKGAYYFMGENKIFLLSKNGTSIIIDKTLFDNILVKTIDDNLSFKLVQRGFATAFDSGDIKERLVTINPNFFMIDFTTKCNMNCFYCLRHFENEGEIIGEKELADICDFIITYCKKNYIQNISIQPWGGEPLIAIDRILQAKSLFDKNNVRANFNIQTNGLLLTETMFKILKDNNISFGISIDGLEQIHNIQRKDRIKTIQNIDDKYEICSISANSMFTLDKVKESIQYLSGELGIHYLKFNLLHPNGDLFDKSLLISGENIAKFVDNVLFAVIEQNAKGIKCIEANIQDKLLNLLIRVDNDICHSRGCMGGKKFISFSRDGKIYPCELIGSEDNCIGSIYDGIDLVEMISLSTEHISYFIDKENTDCRCCPWKYYCRGGCRASTLSYGKEAHEIDEIECSINHHLYPKLIELILTNDEVVKLLTEKQVKLQD